MKGMRKEYFSEGRKDLGFFDRDCFWIFMVRMELWGLEEEYRIWIGKII